MNEKVEQLLVSDMPKNMVIKYTFDIIKESFDNKKMSGQLEIIKQSFCEKNIDEEKIQLDIQKLLQSINNYQECLITGLKSMHVNLDDIIESFALISSDGVILDASTKYFERKILSVCKPLWDEQDEEKLDNASKATLPEIKQNIDIFITGCVELSDKMSNILEGMENLSIVFSKQNIKEAGLEDIYNKILENDRDFDRVGCDLFNSCEKRSNDLVRNVIKEKYDFYKA